jgi:hypothetical protein
MYAKPFNVGRDQGRHLKMRLPSQPIFFPLTRETGPRRDDPPTTINPYFC